MSVDYEVYAEARIRDAWYGINPCFQITSTCFVQSPVMEGKSALAELVDHLRQNSKRVLASELSSLSFQVKDQAQKHVPELLTVFVASYEKSVKRITANGKRTSCDGYVLRDRVHDYVRGLSCVDSFLTRQEYLRLPECEQLDYTYFEWDDSTCLYSRLVELETVVDSCVHQFQGSVIEYNCERSFQGFELPYESDPEVRLVVFEIC